MTGHALDVLDRPAMLIHDAAVRANVGLMARYCAEQGVLHAPHSKTSMSAYVIDLQAEAGVWGQTVASVAHAATLQKLGVRQFLLANVLVDQPAIAWVARRILSRPEEETNLVCYVDSAEGLELLELGLARSRANRKLGVLVEVGFPDGRTGVRSVPAAVELARQVARSPRLELRGVACFEGLVPARGESATAPVVDLLHKVKAAVVAMDAAGCLPRTPIVTAGGSAFPDLVVRELGPTSFGFGTTTILRAGCYVTHDHGLYRDISPFDGRAAGPAVPRLAPALELIATVLSRPEPELAVVGFGRRHVPTDDRLPVVLGVFDEEHQVRPAVAEVVRINDQHAMVRTTRGSALRPGDAVSIGISHPCGAFDRWRSIAVVSETRHVIGACEPNL